jgi:hypothetical protein
VDFKFKFEFPFEFFLLVLFATCIGTSNFLIQVSQSKFTMLKTMSREICGEIMRLFPKGLNPLKIPTKFVIGFASKLYDSKSRENLKLGQKGNLISLKLSATLPSLEIIGNQEGWFCIFKF